jgi:hypothetical protein
MKIRNVRAGLLATSTAVAAVVVLVPASPAAAAIDPASYYHVDQNFTPPTPGEAVGGLVFCPRGMKAVTVDATGSLYLTALTTTLDGNGVFVTASSGVQASARCVPAAQVQASTVATMAIRDHRPYEYYQAGRATCPLGTIAYGGGGLIRTAAGQPLPAGAIYASTPGVYGDQWLFAGVGDLSPGHELLISTHCLPRSQFGLLVSVTETETAPNPTPTLSAPTTWVTARCPAGFYAYTGGAFIHRKGSQTPEFIGYLRDSTMTADDRGWFARAFTFVDDSQLTAVVKCMSRVVD